MKTSEPTPLDTRESALMRLRRKIRSSPRLSGGVKMLVGLALPVLPTLLLLGLMALGADEWSPASRLLVKYSFGSLVAVSLVAGGVAVLQGLIELVTGIRFGLLSAKWDRLGKRGQVVLGLAIYLVVLAAFLCFLVLTRRAIWAAYE